MVASAADRRALAGANLGSVNLTGITFVGEALDLTGTKFDGATLTGVNFSLARLAGAIFNNVSAAGASFNFADLSGDPGANFSGMSTNLQGANFVNADVSGASFVGADLSSANFTGALGIGANFSGVTAPNAFFTGAHLYGHGRLFRHRHRPEEHRLQRRRAV